MHIATSKPPRWKRRSEARPSELLDAALDLLAEKGYAATRMDDVAARAGVTKGTLYLYFPNKEELFKAVVRQAVTPHLDHGEKIVEQHQGSSEDLIRNLIKFWWDVMDSSRIGSIPKLVLAESGNFPEVANFYFEEAIKRSHRIFAKALQRGIDSGEFRKLDANYAMRVMITPMVFALLWKHSFARCVHEEMDNETYLKTYIDLLLNGILKTRSVVETKRCRGKNSRSSNP